MRIVQCIMLWSSLEFRVLDIEKNIRWLIKETVSKFHTLNNIIIILKVSDK